MRTLPRAKSARAADRDVRPWSWRLAQARFAWWLVPTAPVVLLWLPLAWLAHSLPEADYLRHFRTRKYVDWDVVAGTAVGAAAFLAAATAVLVVVRPRTRAVGPDAVARRPLVRFRLVVFRLYLVGLASSFVAGSVRTGSPGELVSLVLRSLFRSERGLSNELRLAFEPVPGLTSLTQLGIVVAVVELTAYLRGTDRTRTRARRRLLVVLAAAMFRAGVASERLALVEIVLPLAVTWLAQQQRVSLRKAVGTIVAPVVGIVLLVFMFAGTEYFRSWQYYREVTDDSLLRFSSVRLSGYYATAFNNGALYLDRADPWFLGATVARGPLSFPGAQEVLGLREPPYDEVLRNFANPEFNNVAPIGQLLAEGGAIWVVVAMTVYGALAVASYRSFQSGGLAATVLFGMVTTSLWEFPRTWYLTNQRLVAPLLATAALFAIERATCRAAAARQRLPAREPGAGSAGGGYRARGAAVGGVRI